MPLIALSAKSRRNLTEWVRRRPALLALINTRIGQAMKRHLWPPVVHEPELAYQSWMAERLSERNRAPACTAEPGLLSFLTSAWNTNPHFLDQLAKSLLGQEVRHSFEWILLDNGSQKPETVSRLRELGSHRQVNFQRVENNLGIIGGMRHCLERAKGKYIIPLDSDDVLYPDAVSVLARFIKDSNFPPILYSDEDRLQNGRFHLPYHKPDWDPVLFQNSCYIAHLCAIDRALALELGAYTEREAEGCHDWDTFIRFIKAGHTPAHLPEIIYSWRMHGESCAGNIDSKSYIHSSHRHVLGKLLALRPRSNRFSIQPSPLFSGTPDWRFVRDRLEPRPLLSVLLCHDPERPKEHGISPVRQYPGSRIRILPWYSKIGELRTLAEEERERGGIVHLQLEDIELPSDESIWEAIGLMELFPDTVMAGGRIHNSEDRITAAGEHFGFGGPSGCPDLRRPLHDPGYFAHMHKQHSVSAVPAVFSFIDAGFLAELLGQDFAPAISIPYLGAWAGAHATRNGKRVVYSPFISGKSDTILQMLAGKPESMAFLKRNADLVPDTRYLSRSLSLDPDSPYSSATEEQRQEIMRRHGSENRDG